MDREKILKRAYIPEEIFDMCYITEKNMIFTPHFTEEGVMNKTGEEVYKEWISNKSEQ